MDQALLITRDLRKTFQTAEGALPVLRGIDMTVLPGESVALTGESGSGKSTLLHCVGCLEQADGGEILLRGQDIRPIDDTGRAALRRDVVSVIFQQFNLIPSLTVRQNLNFQARLTGRWNKDWMDELTARLGLDDLLERFPEDLSGGQQQRVAIGRAIAHKPALVLADEPTGNLDEATSDTVLALLLDLVADVGAGLLMVTHSQRLAARLARHVHLEHGRLA